MEITPLPLSALPEILTRELEKYHQQFNERNPDYQPWLAELMTDQEFCIQLQRCWVGSRYCFDQCRRLPELFKTLIASQELGEKYQQHDIANRLSKHLADIEAEDLFNKALRQFRTTMMLRIIWRDLNRLADLQETTADVTALADACIQQTMDFHYQKLITLYGVPTAIINNKPVAQTMLVLGMGKLGAWELNLSSDIDLIFAFPESGETVGSKRSLNNSEFFTRLARKLIQSLDQITADGFVFRVDMRLRPYGESGALVASFDAMEEYYQDQGREWERYAMVKARVVAGDVEQGKILTELLRPFTYRRYIDFSVIEALRSMKRMIRQEIKRRRLTNDIKLGAGGIREVEFIAQSFQLIRGGRERELQERRVLKVLSMLAEKKYLKQTAVTSLQQAYIFLRHTEHAIQAFNDQQTQTLPDTAFAQAALAYSMGFEKWSLFLAQLNDCRQQVDQEFIKIIADGEDEEADTDVDVQWSGLWAGSFSDEVSLQYLQQAGHEAAEEVLNRILFLRESGTLKRMQAVGRARLDQFMPRLLQAVTSAQQPSSTLLRILPLVDSVLRRTAYLVLLVENPGALKQLVFLCAGSASIAKQLTRHPVLLDELLETRSTYQVPERMALQAELQQQTLRMPMEDLEAHMEALRYFKQAHQLHASVAELTDQLPLMKISDYLTILAEVILEHVLELAWYNLTEKYGYPQKAAGVACDKDFIILGYGKLGGIELGHSSDLDLVFIHNAGPGLGTDGERAVDNDMFFTRLVQRMIHILTTQTPSGMLYEVDVRLRPSGASGLLVSSLDAFEAYQQQNAWTWEHQALVRARPVAGDPQLAQAFVELRKRLLCQPRDEQALKQDVETMRQKMRDHLLPKGLEQAQTPILHLKHGSGGIVDIEFMVQYAVLAWAHQYPDLAVYTDNIRILESLQQAGLFSEGEAAALIDAYKAYRAHVHRLSLLEQPAELPMLEFELERNSVLSKWLDLMG